MRDSYVLRAQFTKGLFLFFHSNILNSVCQEIIRPVSISIFLMSPKRLFIIDAAFVKCVLHSSCLNHFVVGQVSENCRFSLVPTWRLTDFAVSWCVCVDLVMMGLDWLPRKRIEFVLVRSSIGNGFVEFIVSRKHSVNRYRKS